MTQIITEEFTVPSEPAIDIYVRNKRPANLATSSRGTDVYCLDVRGCGRSTRPKQMSEPTQTNPPIARTPDAVKDIAAVLNFILERRSIPQLNLLGWSWGCTLMALRNS
jgi:pimeloyl-ACP methyl ester carboxylesterase